VFIIYPTTRNIWRSGKRRSPERPSPSLFSLATGYAAVLNFKSLCTHPSDIICRQCGPPMTELYNSSAFCASEGTRSRSTEPVLVDRSTRGTATDWSIGSPPPFAQMWRFRGRSLAPASLLISDGATKTLVCHRSVLYLISSLRVGITYFPLSTDVSSTTNGRRSRAPPWRDYVSPQMLFRFAEQSTLDTRPILSARELAFVFFLKNCIALVATVETISSLNATSSAICLFCRAWQWNTLYTRDATVRFDHLHPFILRGIADFLRQVWSAAAFAFVSREIYSYPTLYPTSNGAGWIFIISFFAPRYWSIKSVISVINKDEKTRKS